MKTLLTILICFFYFVGYSQSFEVVLATDFEGNITKGKKEELIKYIREGKPVRVGWQLDFNEDKISDFDHWAEATFITILGDDVFTQIDPIYMQGPNMDIPQVEIFPSDIQWTAIIGTNSKLLNRFILNDKQINKIKEDENLTAEEKKEKVAIIEKSNEEMGKVDSWDVATFWSVQK